MPRNTRSSRSPKRSRPAGDVRVPRPKRQPLAQRLLRHPPPDSPRRPHRRGPRQKSLSLDRRLRCLCRRRQLLCPNPLPSYAPIGCCAGLDRKAIGAVAWHRVTFLPGECQVCLSTALGSRIKTDGSENSLQFAGAPLRRKGITLRPSVSETRTGAPTSVIPRPISRDHMVDRR